MKAQLKLENKLKQQLHICVGLDTDMRKIPKHLLGMSNPVVEFNKIIIENTKDLAAAYKLNFAFYEKDGSEGFRNLEETIKLIPDDLIIIADAKRGDIGNTAKMYAESVFSYFNCDAVTVNPYMGFDSVEPFLEYEDKITFVLGLTSNQSAVDFELLQLKEGKLLYQKILEKINEWNRKENCGAVFGATKLEQLKENLPLLQNIYSLLPGVGAQGGNLEEIVRLFNEKKYNKFIVNISRSLIYADDSMDFGEVTRNKLREFNRIVENNLS